MKARTSKFQSGNLGRIDLPDKKAKKINKAIIKRKRRLLEKREANREIDEALSQM